MLEPFSGIPSLQEQHVRSLLSSVEIPFRDRVELASGLSVTMKPNWVRIYREDRVRTRRCPHVGIEFVILCNGNVVLCRLDYNGRTTFANVGDSELQHMLVNLEPQQGIATVLHERCCH